jgi:hypothetical protein
LGSCAKNGERKKERDPSPLFQLTILHTNPVIGADLKLTERLELVTFPFLLKSFSCIYEWIYENSVNENFTLVKRFFWR